MHLRFQLTVAVNEHLLYLFPLHVLDEPVVEDVIATPVGPDMALVRSIEVMYMAHEPVWTETWHAYFRRVAEERP